MSIARDELLKISRLARLSLSDEELDALTIDLANIVKYVNQLQPVDTHNVKPFAHAATLESVFRDDESIESLPVDAALANAPARHGDFYRVPSVFDT
jgi:aspartyl-tRNA(Asn)/glutamyl-tRNA(Gln) amidotransferase subunit C